MGKNKIRVLNFIAAITDRGVFDAQFADTRYFSSQRISALLPHCD